MVIVKIKGLKRVRKMFSQLPDQMNKQIMKGGEEFMRFTQKSAKLRAPRATGFLASQIKIRKLKNEIILDTGEAYYAYFQEFGFTPHWIPTAFIGQHSSLSPNIPGQFVQNPKFVQVSRFHPFLFPALEAGLARLPNILLRKAKEAIDKSRK